MRKLWAHLLHGQLTTEDALNIIFNMGRVAADTRFDEHAAALASVRYFHTSLEQAWRESRRGGSLEARAQSISHSFFEFDKSEAKHLLEDQPQKSQREVRAPTGAASKVTADDRFCARFLLGSCTGGKCGFKHDCSFCPAPEHRAKQCFLSRLRNFGLDATRKDQRGDNQRSSPVDLGHRGTGLAIED